MRFCAASRAERSFTAATARLSRARRRGAPSGGWQFFLFSPSDKNCIYLFSPETGGLRRRLVAVGWWGGEGLINGKFRARRRSQTTEAESFRALDRPTASPGRDGGNGSGGGVTALRLYAARPTRIPRIPFFFVAPAARRSPRTPPPPPATRAPPTSAPPKTLATRPRPVRRLCFGLIFISFRFLTSRIVSARNSLRLAFEPATPRRQNRGG